MVSISVVILWVYFGETLQTTKIGYFRKLRILRATNHMVYVTLKVNVNSKGRRHGMWHIAAFSQSYSSE